MKKLFIFILFIPLYSWAQTDSLRLIRTDTLKPIESDLLPAYHSRYGTSSRTQYMYDGFDVRHPKDLGQYILTLGDPNAIHEFNKYVDSRHTGGWLIAGSVTSMIIGGIIMGSNGPGNDGKFTIQQPYVCPTGYACGGVSGSLVYGGQIAGYQTVTDTKRQNAYGVGGLMLLGGAILTGVGWGLHLPGNHVRRAVQYYNRALKQRGISWQLAPYSSGTNSAIGLVGRF